MKPLGPLHYHEALDRSCLIMELIENALLQHPAIKAHPKWFKRVEKAHAELLNLYQEIGAKRL